MIRVLVADDSAACREHLAGLLERDAELSVVGEAGDGEEAVRLAERLRPDVILCAVHMPRMNGYEAARRIMESCPAPVVMATSIGSAGDAGAAFDALQAGALAVVEKPAIAPDERSAAIAGELVRTVRLMAGVRVVRRWPAQPAAPLAAAPAASRRPRVIAIGASTGGPAVVRRLLEALPDPLGCPILLVQHITAGFTTAFAEWLGTATLRPVELARGGRRALAGTVYVAPSGADLGISRAGTLTLRRRTQPGGFCPSVSELFRSVADVHGPGAVGIVLTGMGRDGAEGLLRLREAGGLTIVQDEASSVVFGMPAAAIELGAARRVLPPERIAGVVRSLMVEAA